MRVVVDLALFLAALCTLPYWFTRMACTGRLRTDWSGRFGGARVPGDAPSGHRVLLHAVSVGEVGAIRGLVEQLDALDDLDVVIASTTDTGVKRARELFGADHAVVRWPLDFSWAVGRFLDAVRPTVVGLVELEVWPNMTAMSRARGIRTVVVSGRLSDRSHRRYRLIGPLVRRTFARLDGVGAQTGSIADRFVDLGARPEVVEVAGNMKWDSTPISDDVPEAAESLARELGIDRTRLLVVAGSTAPGEEALIRRSLPDGAQLLCAPRRPEWWDGAFRDLSPCVRRTTGPGDAASGRFLLDTIGELSNAYALADIVVIGRSFGDLHGSDPVEPIALGAATIIGPRDADFHQAVTALVAQGGLIQCTGEELAEALGDLAADSPGRAACVRAGRQVIEAQQGATRRCVELLVGGGRKVERRA